MDQPPSNRAPEIEKNDNDDDYDDDHEPIQNEFLKCVIQYYGVLGLQIRQVKLKQWKTVVNLMWNIVITIAVVYGLTASNLFQFVDSRKPFFSKVILVAFFIIYPTNYASMTINYAINGRTLFQYMDLLNGYYPKISRKNFILIVLIIILYQLILYIPYFQGLLRHGFRGKVLDEFLSQISWFFFNNHVHLMFQLIIIHQMGVQQLLSNIEQRLLSMAMVIEAGNGTNTKNQIRLSLIQNLSYVADICQKINREFSFLLLQFTIMAIVNITQLLCIIVIYHKFYLAIIHIIVVFTYFIILAHLNCRIHQQIHWIRFLLLQPYWNDYQERIENKNAIGQPRPAAAEPDHVRRLSRERHWIKQHDPIRWFEMTKVYAQDFRIGIYDLWIMDYRFVFSMTLFLINYVVFIAQTN